MISALGPSPFVRPLRSSAAPVEPASEPNPWPALEKGLSTTYSLSANGTGALAPALEQALQRFQKAGLSFATDSFKPDPVLPREAIAKILEGSTVKVAFQNGAMAKLKGMADLRVLDGLVGLGSGVLTQAEQETLQAWDSLASRGYAPRTFGSDPVDGRAQKLAALQDLRNGSSVTLAGPGDETQTFKTPEELKALDFLSGGPEWPLPEPEKARTLRQASEHGLIFYRYSRACTPYDQYKDSEPVVSVGRAGTPRISLSLEQLQNLPATDALLADASAFHTARLGALYDQLKVTESPAPLPLAWNQLRQRFSPEVAEAVAAEMLESAAIGGQGTGWYSIEKVWQLSARMGEFARDDYQLACLAKGLAPLLETGKLEDADRALLRLVKFERERELTDPEQTTLMTLLEGTRSVSAAQEGTDLVRIPLSDESLEQREQVFLSLARSLAPSQSHRTAEFYRCVLAEKVRGESLATTGARLESIHHACQTDNRENQALGAFRSIQRILRENPHTAEQADEVVQKFLHALLLGRDTKTALSSLQDGKQAASVQAGERHVTVGGVRVPRRKSV